MGLETRLETETKTKSRDSITGLETPSLITTFYNETFCTFGLFFFFYTNLFFRDR